MDEVLCELESEKATFELPAEAEGTLKIVAQEGDTLEIGAVICEIDEKSGDGSADDLKKPVAATISYCAVESFQSTSHQPIG